MTNNNYLIDSNIIIYHLNNNKVATNFLIKYLELSAISLITYIEVLSFDFDSIDEENQVKELLNQFTIFDIDKSVSKQALINRKLKRIKLPDNIIVSTAQVNNLTLVTKRKPFNH